ncbi:MAG: metal ABC transporter substrate-binding protein [Acidobacteria bacterium]|nr:metal ABC transporter substrate-binding protein [Acidobacteriota bacterium]
MRSCRVFPSLIALALLLPSPVASIPAAAGTLVVGATIFPVADIARRVAGPHARVIQVLPAGASPHTFDLTPVQVRELQPARLIFKIGGLDDWIDGVVESLPRAVIVPMHKRIARRPFHDDGHGHGHGAAQGEEEFDPHYWLSAANGAIMARTIADTLSTIDPAHAPAFAENCRNYAEELAGLHGKLKQTLAVLKNKRMIVLHDGWRYFAAAYGLEIAAVFQPSPGQEPTPRELQQLYAAARHSGVRAIFSEPQLPAASLEPLLRDLGLTLVVLDPLGGAQPGDSYAALLRRNARAVLRALGR